MSNEVTIMELVTEIKFKPESTCFSVVLAWMFSEITMFVLFRGKKTMETVLIMATCCVVMYISTAHYENTRSRESKYFQPSLQMRT